MTGFTIVRPPLRAFTLIELAMVMAVIATLTAIALPQVHEYQLRAKSVEVALVFDGVERQLDGFCLEPPIGLNFGLQSAGASLPGRDPGRQAVDWMPAADAEDNWAWSMIGYAPDGQVRGGYQIDGLTRESCSTFWIYGYTDLDGGDAEWQVGASYAPISVRGTCAPLGNGTCFPVPNHRYEAALEGCADGTTEFYFNWCGEFMGLPACGDKEPGNPGHCY